MESIQNSINNEQSLNVCNDKSPLVNKVITDPIPEQCNPQTPNLNHPGTVQDDFFRKVNTKKTGFGSAANCDPVLTGKLYNDPNDKDPTHIHRYPQAIRGTDEAVLDLFRDVIVIDENGKSHNVPVIFGTQEKAVAWILQENVRQDITNVVDRIRLPMMSLQNSDIQFQPARYTFHKARRFERVNEKPSFVFQEKHLKDTVYGYSRGIPIDVSYTLNVWTLYMEDMAQIIEQIMLKTAPQTYIRVRGVHWEVAVKLESSGNNIDTEPGDQNVRVIKYQFNFLAESYIPQPITRDKAVLKIRAKFVDGTEIDGTNDDFSSVLGETEIEAEELHD